MIIAFSQSCQSCKSCLKISRRKHDKRATADGQVEFYARLAALQGFCRRHLARHRDRIPDLNCAPFARRVEDDIALPLSDDEEPVCVSITAVGRSELRLVVLAVTTPPVVVGRDVDEFSIVDVFSALEHRLAAPEVADECGRVLVPCHIAVYMCAREILGAWNAELLRRARERVPYEAVCAVGERNVGERLERRRLDRPVPDHVCERLKRDDAPILAARRKDRGALVEPSAPVRPPCVRPL